MRNERNKWEQSLKQKLDNYPSRIDDRLWENIERNLPVATPKKRFSLIRREIRSVAALLAFAVAGSCGYLFFGKIAESNSPSSTPIATETVKYPASSHAADIPVAPKEGTALMAATASPQTAKSKTQTPVPFAISIATASPAPTQAIPHQEEKSKSAQQINDQDTTYHTASTPEQQSPNYAPLRQASPSPTRKTRHARQAASPNKPIGKKWTVGVEFGNGISASQPSKWGYTAKETALLLNNNETQIMQTLLMKSPTLQPKRKVRYAFPITAGITLRRYISNKFSIETGLQYTLLKTEATSGNGTYTRNMQKLQYIGVPLKANYDLLHAGPFFLYVSAGATIEGCVSAKDQYNYYINNKSVVEYDQTMDIRKVQCSVNAAVGFEIRLLDLLGLYAEPGATYFFNDGNEGLDNIRRAHPFNFQFKAGIRVNF